MRPLIALLIALLPAATPAFSEGREVIGNGRLFTNDFFGDGCATGGARGLYVYSHVRSARHLYGPQKNSVRSHRIRVCALKSFAPATGPAPGDRPHVGAMSIGAITHFDYSGFQVSLGSELTAVGP